ncbi:MAG: ABC transporter permease [Acidobacteria bacterium]|jgi:lipopolysaccharide transport system permease protein|nr:ABC transporter permease [Acidobacteriota bacterium]
MFTNYSKDIHSENLSIESDKLSDEYFTVIIEPAGTWLKANWAELWEHRELFYFLTLRDIKIRYKQTLLGITWVLLQPTISTIVFSILFTNLGQTNPLNVPYPVFAFSGFTVWIFIAVAISSGSSSLIGNPNLITKVYLPRLILPLSAIAANLLDLLLGLISLIIVMAIYGVTVSRTLIFAPLFLILCFTIATSLGILLSAINVRYRDVKYILPVVLQLWLFVTPVFYSLDMIPEETRWIWKLNPMTGALGGFRAALFGASFDSFEIAVSVVVAVILVILALQIFYRMEDSFADVI